MMLDWKGFLELARELASRNDETSQRAAINRAYYGAYHRARQIVEQNGSTLHNDGRAHSDVWRILDSGDIKQRVAAANGRFLFQIRKRADYQPTMADVRKDASTAIALSQAIALALDAGH